MSVFLTSDWSEGGVFGEGGEVAARIAVGESGEALELLGSEGAALFGQQLLEQLCASVAVGQGDVDSLGKATEGGLVQFLRTVGRRHDHHLLTDKKT